MKFPLWLKTASFRNKRTLSRKRFYIQILFAVLLNFSFAFTGFFALRWLCLPVINCWACPWAIFGCPVGVMANLAALQIVAFGALGVLATTAVLLGRWTCGWACPFGWFQELLYMIPTPKLILPAVLRFFKYAALVLMVFALPWMFGGGTVNLSDLQPLESVVFEQPLPDEVPPDDILDEIPEIETPATPTPAPQLDPTKEFISRKLFYCYYCPAGALEASIPMQYSPESFQVRLDNDRRKKILAAGRDPADVPDDDPDFPRLSLEGSSFTVAYDKLGVLFVFLMMFVLLKRPFCRIACPVGASLGLLSRVSLLRLKVDQNKCIKCDACTKCCPQGISIYKPGSPISECVLCNECVHVCPTKAISYENPFNLKKAISEQKPPQQAVQSDK